MDWLPNEDAMIFFIQDILPVIKKKISDVSLTVVGRNPSPHLIKIIRENPEIELTGWVEDTRPYIAQCALFIVPIRIGGGTRMKIFEAMAMGKVVVSTSIGAEGLPIDNGKNIVIEDSPIVFAQKINELLLPGNDRISVESNALELVQKNFTWSVVAKRFLDICDSLI
jgi:glycosyltransferase involved in cell wall biosynthesis